MLICHTRVLTHHLLIHFSTPTCQALVLKEQPYGKAVLRLTAERREAQEQLGPLEVRARLLEAGCQATLSA